MPLSRVQRPLLMLLLLVAAPGCEDRPRQARLSGPTGRMVQGDYRMPVRALDYSTDGRFLLAGDNEGRVHRFDLAAGTTETFWTGHNAPITALALREDGRLSSFGLDGAFRITSLTRESPEYRSHVAETPLAAVRLSPDGLTALAWEGSEAPGGPPTHCGSRGAPLGLRRDTGELVRPLASNSVCAAFALGSGFVAYAAGDLIRVAALPNGAEASRIKVPDLSDIRGMAVTADGKRVAALIRGELRLYEAGNDTPYATIGHAVVSERPLPVYFTRDGASVVALLPDVVEPGRYNLDRYDAATGEMATRLMASVPDTVAAAALSGDSEFLVLAEQDGRINRVRLRDGERLPDLEAHHWLGGGTALSADGRRVATCWQSEVQIFEVETGRRLARNFVPGLACVVDYPFALRPDGEAFVVGAEPAQPFVARDLQGNVSAAYERPPGSTVHGPVFTRNGQWLAALVIQGGSGRIFVWPADGGAPRGDALLPPMSGLRGLAVSGDGSSVVASFGHMQDDGSILGEVAGFRMGQPAGPVWARGDSFFEELGQVAFTPDEQRILFSSEADEVVVLDAATGNVVDRLVNSADTVWAYARFGTVGVYSLKPALERPTPRQPRSYANALVVSPDGRYVAVAGYNRSNRVPLLEVFDLTNGGLVSVNRILSYPRALLFVEGSLLSPGVAAPAGDLSRFELTPVTGD